MKHSDAISLGLLLADGIDKDLQHLEETGICRTCLVSAFTAKLLHLTLPDDMPVEDMANFLTEIFSGMLLLKMKKGGTEAPPVVPDKRKLN